MKEIEFELSKALCPYQDDTTRFSDFCLFKFWTLSNEVLPVDSANDHLALFNTVEVLIKALIHVSTTSFPKFSA